MRIPIRLFWGEVFILLCVTFSMFLVSGSQATIRVSCFDCLGFSSVGFYFWSSGHVDEYY